MGYDSWWIQTQQIPYVEVEDTFSPDEQDIDFVSSVEWCIIITLLTSLFYGWSYFGLANRGCKPNSSKVKYCQFNCWELPRCSTCHVLNFHVLTTTLATPRYLFPGAVEIFIIHFGYSTLFAGDMIFDFRLRTRLKKNWNYMFSCKKTSVESVRHVSGTERVNKIRNKWPANPSLGNLSMHYTCTSHRRNFLSAELGGSLELAQAGATGNGRLS
jgi:hypothetical protein